MQVERIGVFETNSSSTHSICISRRECKEFDKIPSQDGVFVIFPGEFGWEEQEHNDATTKASYCLTYVKNYNLESDEQMLREVLETTLGGKVEFLPNGGYHDWGYIDHQSSEVCGEAFGSKVTLKNFIFNPHSYLRTDNDNH